MIGASFIGLEVAASLRARGIETHVMAPEKIPMEKVLGAEMGRFVRALHEEHGVIFHLEDSAAAFEGRQVKLKSGGEPGSGSGDHRRGRAGRALSWRRKRVLPSIAA